MNFDISSIPDYSAFQKLAAALWQKDNSFNGAAIMVGAGFSRSFAVNADKSCKMPLWMDFSKVMSNELGSNSIDPLRLAEEYSAYFGKQALYDLIKKELKDASWLPSEVHSSLLKLPWSEVLTTNWDTLLERAAGKIHEPVYNIVLKQEDLSNARSPRIVKLHGTIDLSRELVFTQEDYRKYTQYNAALVNFARQVFIENELCLLGFSGDDPNFLQWAGWVRDHLEIHSRRIYIVGALNLSAAKRKYLESINVAPIDLSGLVTHCRDHDEKHLIANKIFIDALGKSKPKQMWEWEPATNLNDKSTSSEKIEKANRDSEIGAELLKNQLTRLEADRLSYPGWLICPPTKHHLLKGQIRNPFPTEKNLSKMSPPDKAKILYESAWRHQVSFEPLSMSFAKELFELIKSHEASDLEEKKKLEIAVIILINSRYFDNADYDSINNELIENLNEDRKNDIIYFQSLIARDEFDCISLSKLIQEISAEDPMWKLKKASLLAELGEFDKGEELISSAYKDLLEQYRRNPNSVYVFSRLAWVHWLKRGIDMWVSEKEIEEFPSKYQDLKCSPWDHIEWLGKKVSKSLEKQKQQTIEPSFEPGYYRDNSKSLRFSSETHPYILLEKFSSEIGIPLKWNNINFLTDSASKITELEDLDDKRRSVLAIRAASAETSEIIKKNFSRIKVALLSDNDVEFLSKSCLQAINYWVEGCSLKSSMSKTYSAERLRVFIEVLARLSVRADKEKAKEYLQLAISLAKNPALQNYWLFGVIKGLIGSTLNSIPEETKDGMLLEILSFPLKKELNFNSTADWPNPIIKPKSDRVENAVLDNRIDEIIESLVFGSPENAPALLRLIPLMERGFLKAIEMDKIADKIWGINPDYKVLPETGLLQSALLVLPKRNADMARARVWREIFENIDNRIFDKNFLSSMLGVYRSKLENENLKARQAASIFEKLISWRKEIQDDDVFMFSYSDQNGLAKLIGQVLSNSIVPSLHRKSINEKNFEKLKNFYLEVDTPEVIEAFVYFAVANRSFAISVEKIIRQGLQSKDANRLASSAHAILAWRNIEKSEAVNRLVSRLLYLIEFSRLPGLSALLWTAREMHEKGYFSKAEKKMLSETLPLIFDDSSYGNIPPSSYESVSVSLVRAECVKFARNLSNDDRIENSELKRILMEAKKDALPEVRFA